MNKIQRTSRYLRWIFTALMIISPILSVATWMYITAEPKTPNQNFMTGFVELRGHLTLMQHPLTMPLRLIGLAVGLIPLSINLLIYYNFIRLFSLYERNEFFNLENVAVIRKIGIFLLLGQLLSPFVEAATTTVLTWQNAPGHRSAMFSLDNNNIGLIITGIMIILISWIINEGHRLNEEQQLTI